MNKPPVHYGKENNMYRHGYSRAKLEKAYVHMIERCYKPTCSSYKNYGARGITVCDEWKDSNIAFFEWSVNNGYAEGLSIDRIDPNGNYCPENCRWVDMKTQQNNRTNNIKVEINGVTRTVAEWADLNGINRYCAYTRIKRLGWDKVKAVTVKSTYHGGKRKEK